MRMLRVRMLSGKVQKKYPPCKKVFIRVGVNQDNDFYFNLPSDFANPKRKNLQKANTCVEQAGMNFFDECILFYFPHFANSAACSSRNLNPFHSPPNSVVPIDIH